MGTVAVRGCRGTACTHLDQCVIHDVCMEMCMDTKTVFMYQLFVSVGFVNRHSMWRG